MSKPRFKYGDRVLYGHARATVISVRKVTIFSYLCTIKFDNSDLMPPEMEVDQKHLKFLKPDEEVCPICGSRWKVVKFNMHTWKDCVSCGKTSEELIKEAKEGPPPIPKSEDELLKEFEKMLDEDDDDDDFGVFTF